jgi:hypothetical protein
MSVSNLRHPLIKAMLPQRAMLMVEQAVQQPLGRFYFGPGTFFLLRKRVARRIVREVPLQASFVTGLGEFGDGTKPPESRNGSQPAEPEANPVGGARPHSQGNFADQGDETDDCPGA